MTITRVQWLKLQQEFIEQLNDTWIVDLTENGIVFKSERGKIAELSNTQYSDLDPNYNTVLEEYAHLSGLTLRTALAQELKSYLRKSGIVTSRIICSFQDDEEDDPIFKITFPTVNDAVKALFLKLGFAFYEFIKYPEDIAEITYSMQQEIFIS